MSAVINQSVVIHNLRVHYRKGILWNNSQLVIIIKVHKPKLIEHKTKPIIINRTNPTKINYYKGIYTYILVYNNVFCTQIK